MRKLLILTSLLLSFATAFASDTTLKQQITGTWHGTNKGIPGIVTLDEPNFTTSYDADGHRDHVKAQGWTVKNGLLFQFLIDENGDPYRVSVYKIVKLTPTTFTRALIESSKYPVNPPTVSTLHR